ncbi:MAG: RluA family pseudouridine synthase [Bacteroidetes bacterium]|nr:RluA family pseudouridine synthase [Bacteroidota bacterium]
MAKNSGFSDLIIKEDQDYILINKPPFISTLDDRNDPANILAMAREYEPEAQVCHRLDKETSGILVIARNAEAYRHLSMQFEHREVKKIYHAVSDGVHHYINEEVTAPILKLSDGTVRISGKGKEATTFFTTMEVFARHTLFECRPLTGRMHQIRIHLTCLQAPITGDTLYGGKPFFVSSVKRDFRVKKGTEEQPLIKRLALHAFSLEFEGLHGGKVSVQAPYPKDFTALLRQLSSHKG